VTTYLPRSAWTTVPAAGSPMPSRPLGLAVHWPGSTVPLGDPSQQSVANRLEGYRRYHVNGHGWSDIAYQVAIDQSGRVWDLRGIDRESAANGDQSVNLTYGACLFLVGPGESPSASLRAAFNDWRRDHWLVKYPGATRVVGHRDIRPTGGTDCPGPITEALVRSGAIVQHVSPDPTPVPVPQEDDEMISKEAQDWIEARLDAHDAYVLDNLKATLGRELLSAIAAQHAGATKASGTATVTVDLTPEA
jgi:hypothetical protein